jgi:hypothetical protein
MLCGYLSLDEVNQDLAATLAAEAGIELDLLSPADTTCDGRLEAVLYDLDSLPEGERRTVLADLVGGCRTRAVAVHTYHLRARQARALRRRGVIVIRRLRAETFARLRAAAWRRVLKSASHEHS